MPRSRQYATDAERQAAYRDRNAHKQPPSIGLMAALARSLHGTIRDAAKAGDECAQAVLGATADETMRRLMNSFKTESGEAPD